MSAVSAAVAASRVHRHGCPVTGCTAVFRSATAPGARMLADAHARAGIHQYPAPRDGAR